MAVQAGDEAGPLAGVHQVGRRGAHVLRRPVAAPHGLHRLAKGLEQGRRLARAAVPDDHRLAAAEVEVGHGVLV